jgi:hypothetical protein
LRKGLKKKAVAAKDNHDHDEEVQEYQKRVLEEVEAEVLANDNVANEITYHRFVSKSKGIRNGKRRYRKHWKEIHLVKHNTGKYKRGFHQWHNFPFDFHATEIIGPHADGEMLKDEIIRLWEY